ncbi:hypothetical protein Tco_0685908 [Tanacetum coccineum]
MTSSTNLIMTKVSFNLHENDSNQVCWFEEAYGYFGGLDEELAFKLHAEEQVELERMQRERVAQEEASSAVLREEFDDVQARIDADALLAARLQEEEREQF